ncbi:MAG: HI0074 family nucleotidyltransferase substrate-binding subunit [Alphaproteobacteria bacterium]|nr:HI0074 family nucleotidyltransferase substrate-binding subunit [Alphaproteobacteria bacterium]
MTNIGNYEFLAKLKSLPFIDEIWLYGSRARGDQTPRSDIDLAILCPKANAINWGQILDVIDNADTLLKIDCIRFDELSVDDKIRQNIIRFKKVLYKKGTDCMDKEFWKDYFDSLGDALARLGDVLKHPDLEAVDYLQDAAIQRFEFTIELFWKVLKKFLAYEKIDTTTPRDVLKNAFQYNFIDDEDVWLLMLDDRNKTSHLYKQEQAKQIFKNIQSHYPVMQRTYDALKNRFYTS